MALLKPDAVYPHVDTVPGYHDRNIMALLKPHGYHNNHTALL